MATTQEEPVLIARPEPGREVPVVYDSPHSGRAYPEGFAPAVPVEDLHGYEDRYVDDLIEGAPGHGIVVLAAAFPRAFIDPNRAADDLDRDIVDEDWTEPLNPSPHSERGVGLIFRTTRSGAPIYERPLRPQELVDRIEAYWRPFHAALDAALDAAVARWGAVWHIDWHSMRPEGDATSADPGEVRPDFVVSDRDGASAGAAFRDHVTAKLRALGYSVAINVPFRGGYIVERAGRPEAGRHSLQIEINRALYLDLDRLELTEGRHGLIRDLDRLAASVAAFARREAPRG